MAERERTRVREREALQQDPYEAAIKHFKDFAERQRSGRILLKYDECFVQQSRQGHLRFYMCPFTIKDTPLGNWALFVHDIKTKSGKHKHNGGLVIYVLEGRGYSTVDGERVDWKKGDVVLLPMKPGGVEHQHFNLDPGKPAMWAAFIYIPIYEYLASEFMQIEQSPDFKG